MRIAVGVLGIVVLVALGVAATRVVTDSWRETFEMGAFVLAVMAVVLPLSFLIAWGFS